MINEYWNLKTKPFSNTPNLKFLYESSEFEEGYARMIYNIKEIQGGLTLITGEIGSGKTFLAYTIKNHLERDEDYAAALITNPRLTSTQLLKNILQNLGEDNLPRYKMRVLFRLEDRLISLNQKGITVVALIDEAQILSLDALREIRLLLNMEQPEGKLMQVVLLGQPGLKKRIKNIPQLKQRINVRFHLEPLSRDETTNYIKHRLNIAGGDKQIFTDDAIELIYERSGGLPRLINNIAQNALFIGFTENTDKIDSDIIKSVADDLQIGDYNE